MATMFVSEGTFERWFAWRPVRLKSGERAWLRWIERQRVYCTIPQIGMAHTLYHYQDPPLPSQET